MCSSVRRESRPRASPYSIGSRLRWPRWRVRSTRPTRSRLVRAFTNDLAGTLNRACRRRCVTSHSPGANRLVERRDGDRGQGCLAAAVGPSRPSAEDRWQIAAVREVTASLLPHDATPVAATAVALDCYSLMTGWMSRTASRRVSKGRELLATATTGTRSCIVASRTTGTRSTGSGASVRTRCSSRWRRRSRG